MREDDGDVGIGLDLGTSGVKALVLGADGGVIARARRDYETQRPEPGAAEQDPHDWTSAIDDAMRELAQAVDPRRWGAIGLSAMLPTLVCVDDALAPVGPGITWEDARAEADAVGFVAAVGDGELYGRTGQHVDGRYLLPMWMRRGRPDLTVAGAKDWIHAELTGVLRTDPSTASGFGCFDLCTGAWDPRLVAAAGSPRTPPVAPSGTTTPLRAEVADRWGCRPGIPVVLGAADSVLGAYGLGALDSPGTAACIAGTSTVLLSAAAEPATDPLGRYLVTPALDVFGLEMDLTTTGSALQWLADLTRTDVAALVTEAAESAPEDSPVVLPYLGPGEQGALWDPGLVGAMNGLTLQTTRGQLARGVQAGIVLELRRCLGVLAAATGHMDAPVLLSGSGGQAGFFRQDLADATGRPVAFDADEHDHSAIGAARFALRTVNGIEPPARPLTAVVHPDPTRAAFWENRFARHEAARRAQSFEREPA